MQSTSSYPFFLRFCLVLFSHLCVGVLNSHFPSCVPIKLCTPLSSLTWVSRTQTISYSLIYHPHNIRLGAQRIWLIMTFSAADATSRLLAAHTSRLLSSAPCSERPADYVLYLISVQVPQPSKTTTKYSSVLNLLSPANL